MATIPLMMSYEAYWRVVSEYAQSESMRQDSLKQGVFAGQIEIEACQIIATS